MQYYARYNRQFESDILTIGCIAGVLRMVIAIYRDLPLTSIDLDFIVDCALLGVFILPLVLMRMHVRYEYISVPFSFLVLGFLCANWIILDGLSGTGEYYFIGGIILMALIHNHNWLVFFVGFCVLLEIVLILLCAFGDGVVSMSNRGDGSNHHYLWTTVVVTMVLLYHKNQFDLKRTQLKQKKLSLEEKANLLEHQNIQLEDQQLMLQKSNDWLESNIRQRSDKLMAQRESIEKYMSVTLFEIKPYLESTLNS